MVLEPCISPTQLQGYIDVFDENNNTDTTMFTIQNETEIRVSIKGKGESRKKGRSSCNICSRYGHGS